MKASCYVAIGLALCAGGCMAESTRAEASGPAKVIAVRTGPLAQLPARARVTLRLRADSLDAQVQAVRLCSSELMRSTPRVQVRESTPRVAALVTVGLLTALGVVAATRRDDSEIRTAGAVLFLGPAALSGALMYSASGEEREPAPPLIEQSVGADTICEVQPWPGALVAVRTREGIKESYADKAGVAHLTTRERPTVVFVNGELVEDVIWASASDHESSECSPHGTC